MANDKPFIFSIPNLLTESKAMSTDLLTTWKDTEEEVKQESCVQNPSKPKPDELEKTFSELPKIYFDHQRNVYWKPNNQGGWMTLNESNIKRLLKKHGVSPRLLDGKHISLLDEVILKIQEEACIDYAGALAGYSAGVKEFHGKKVLVTESPKLIVPIQGGFPILAKFLEGLLVDDECDQRPYFYGWLKVAIEALRQEISRSGQALVVAGEHDCGKSLLQKLITLLLGGRAAKPYQFMTGGTQFNSELFGAEHLMIEDEQASTDIRARRQIGAHIKEFTVNEVQRCHAKNRVAISLNPFWRLTITVNDEPENLMVLPPLDESLQDKMILLRASKKKMPMPTATFSQRQNFWNTLVSELPAFVHFLENWEIPENLVCDRFGITHYHHPQLLLAIDALAPEMRLLNLIDGELFDGTGKINWEGTSTNLERLLVGEGSKCIYEARKLLHFSTACGVYLGRLAQKRAERVSCRTLHGQKIWKINSLQNS